jgi:hypothetical protein
MRHAEAREDEDADAQDAEGAHKALSSSVCQAVDILPRPPAQFSPAHVLLCRLECDHHVSLLLTNHGILHLHIPPGVVVCKGVCSGDVALLRLSLSTAPALHLLNNLLPFRRLSAVPSKSRNYLIGLL